MGARRLQVGSGFDSKIPGQTGAGANPRLDIRRVRRATDELPNSVSARTLMIEMNNIPFCTKPSKEAYMWRMLKGALRSTVCTESAPRHTRLRIVSPLLGPPRAGARAMRGRATRGGLRLGRLGRSGGVANRRIGLRWGMITIAIFNVNALNDAGYGAPPTRIAIPLQDF